MDHDRFIEAVGRLAGVGGEAAERATRAVLQTLGERLSTEEARDLVEQLPEELGPWLLTEGAAERFDVDEFLRRVAERAEVDLDAAERQARAVFMALARALGAEEFADMVAQLPKDFALLLPVGPATEILPVEVFLDRVADRAGLDHDGARRATDAVLETLAERIADGEVEDLIGRLPVPLHAALKRGRARSPGARRMSLERFVGRVAEREGVAPEAAGEHARAVFAALREAVGEELYDVTVQLPPEYAVLWAGPTAGAPRS
jgi:uncharacterized protein (DUF2267 family)